VIDAHGTFVQEDMVAANTLGGLVSSLRHLVHSDTRFAHHLWVRLLPRAWSKLSPAERAYLHKPITRMLGKEWHGRQHSDRPNVIQSLLQGFALCRPMPVITPEVLKRLAKVFSAWFPAIAMFEQQLLYEPTSVAAQEGVAEALTETYYVLKEHDVLYGLWRRRTNCSYSRAALALAQFGSWARAQEMFFTALTRYNRGDATTDGGDAAVDKATAAIPHSEWRR
jgi:transformation/transcription domain-associated protein